MRERERFVSFWTLTRAYAQVLIQICVCVAVFPAVTQRSLHHTGSRVNGCIAVLLCTNTRKIGREGKKIPPPSTRPRILSEFSESLLHFYPNVSKNLT